MLSLRLLGLFSLPSTSRNQLAPILHNTYKLYKETGLRSLSTGSVKVMGSRGEEGLISHQNVVVMRHGERFDNFDPSWSATAARPWDPPLTEAGHKRASDTGRRLRQSVGFPIHRVFVSPFLRCLQTAVELVASLFDEGHGGAVKHSEVKVSIEYGLCEMMNGIAIRPNVAPKDGNMRFDGAVCEAMLPAEIMDKNVEMVYKELPKWEESVLQAEERYQQLIKDLADKYPTQNLLLITHGEGVKVAVSWCKKDAKVNQVDYCGYVELRRPIFRNDHTIITTGEFDLLTHSGETGVRYSFPRSLENDTNRTSP